MTTRSKVRSKRRTTDNRNRDGSESEADAPSEGEHKSTRDTSEVEEGQAISPLRSSPSTRTLKKKGKKAKQDVRSTFQEEPHPVQDRIQQIKDGLKFYDIIIDIHSLKKLRFGWAVHGKHQKEFSINTKLVAFVGEYKSGKTWLIKNLIKEYQDRPLPDDNVVHTPGLCMILPAELKDDSLVKSPAQEEYDKLIVVEKKTRQMQQRIAELKKKLSVNPALVAQTLHGFSFLDTQGTNTACKSTQLTDVRATEYLLRTLIIQLATRVVFVVYRFNRDAQVQIKSLIKQLETAGNPVSEHNRLYVVHNLRDVKDDITLQLCIKEVKEVYDDDGEEDEELPESIKHLKAWQEIPYNGVKYFDARGSRHFFIGDQEYMGEYNNTVLKALELKLDEHNNPKDINILKEVVDKAQILLSGLIKQYSHELILDTSEENPAIVPRFVPNETKQEETEDEQTEFFKLQKLQFYDEGPKGDDAHTLEGRVLLNNHPLRPTKMRVQVKCAGLSKHHLSEEFIRTKWDINNRWILIHIKIPPLEGEDGWTTLRGTFYTTGSKGHYIAELPDDERNLRFRPPADRQSVYNVLSVTNGLLELEVDIAPDINKLYE